ncbi:MAG: cytochrome P450 [Streptosporangiales bacterium]|nr:cytochrome P450 [Streptosporangiales bacterium]
MAVEETLYWDPYDPTLVADPWPLFKRLREEKPLYYNDQHDFYMVFSAADAERVLTDWETFTSTHGGILELIKSGIEMPPGTLIFEDPPAHDIHRKLLAPIFSPRRIKELEPKVREYAARCLDPLVGKSEFDLIDALGREMPMRVIGMLLGIPEEDQAAIRDQADAKLTTEAGQKMDLGDGALISVEGFGDYLDWRVNNPSDDVMTELINAEFEENGERRTLTRDEIVTYLTVLAGAGNETTGRLIGWMGSTLAKYPEVRAELAADPSLIPAAVEEILRLEPAGPFTARYVTKDVELHGQTVPAGSALLVCLGAANRDPAKYPDPDRLDIHRKAGLHLTFLIGPHYCLGSALARLEGRIALEELLKRWPTWDVDWDGAKMAVTSSVRGWEKLPLRVGGSATA